MRAVRVHAFGNLADLSIDDLPIPEPGPGEILVRVRAAALNPLDYKVALRGHRGGRGLPLTLGWDATGMVEAIGPGVDAVSVGDRVCAMADIMWGGALADYVLLGEHNVALAPDSITDEVAAGLPLAGLTALQAWDLGGVEAGASVLVHAGAGGVGHLAIQLAKLRGAEVYATSSSSKLALLAELGADHPIDYHATSPGRFACLADVVLDTLGGEVASTTLRAMKPGSTLVSIVGYAPDPADARDDVRVERMLVEPRARELADLVALVEAQRLRVLIQDPRPIEEVVPAIQALEQGRTVGKRILVMSGSWCTVDA